MTKFTSISTVAVPVMTTFPRLKVAWFPLNTTGPPTCVPLIKTMACCIPETGLPVPVSFKTRLERVTGTPLGSSRVSCKTVTPAAPEMTLNVTGLPVPDTVTEVAVEVGVVVGVPEEVGDGVCVWVGVLVIVGVEVGVGESVAVDVGVGLVVAVGVQEEVGEEVEVGERVFVGVLVIVGV